MMPLFLSLVFSFPGPLRWKPPFFLERTPGRGARGSATGRTITELSDIHDTSQTFGGAACGDGGESAWALRRPPTQRAERGGRSPPAPELRPRCARHPLRPTLGPALPMPRLLPQRLGAPECCHISHQKLPGTGHRPPPGAAPEPVSKEVPYERTEENEVSIVPTAWSWGLRCESQIGDRPRWRLKGGTASFCTHSSTLPQPRVGFAHHATRQCSAHGPGVLPLSSVRTLSVWDERRARPE